MARYVLRWRGDGDTPEDDVAAVRAVPGLVVVDATARMLLVECDEEALRPLAGRLDGWLVGPERVYRVPDTRRRAEQPPA